MGNKCKGAMILVEAVSNIEMSPLLQGVAQRREEEVKPARRLPFELALAGAS